MKFERRIRRTLCSTSLIALSLAFVPQAALAQPGDHPGEKADRPEAAAQTDRIQDIVVTAQRRSQNSQDVPISITAVNSTALDTMGFQQPNDLVNISAGIQVQEVFGKFQPIFAIRGISQSDYNALQSSPVGVYVDEAYIAETFLHGINFFDLEQVEVLKGPQGTLYGKNTTGGAIKIASKLPDLQGGASGNFTIGYGNYNAVHAEAAAETPLIADKLAVRLAASYDTDDGYQRNITLGTKLADTHVFGIRGTLLFQPADDLTMTLRYTHSETDQQSAMPRAIGSYPVGPDGVGLDFGGYYRPATMGFRERESSHADQPVRVKYDLATLSTTYSGAAFDVIAIGSYHSSTKYQALDGDGGLTRTAFSLYTNDTKAYSGDVRLVTTASDSWKLVVGGYYGYDRNASLNAFALYADGLEGGRLALEEVYDPSTAAYVAGFLAQFGELKVRQTLKHESLAAYSQLRWEVTPQIGLDIGLRYTRDRDSQTYYNVSRYSVIDGAPMGSFIPGNITFGTANPVNQAYDPAYTSFLDGPFTLASAPPLSVVNNRVTGRIGLDYKPSDDVMLYASYSRGYRSGNFDTGASYLVRTVSEGAYVKPESITAYEIGLKSDLIDRRLRLNLAGFWYDYKNQQFVDVQGIGSSLRNAGRSRLRGVEAELVIAPLDALTINIGATYLDAKYRDLTLFGNDLSGNQLISAPKLSLTGAIDYHIGLGDNAALQFHVDGSYRSRQWYSAFNERVIADGLPNGSDYSQSGQKGYGLMNARIALDFDDGLNIALWSKNLTNKRYASYGLNTRSAYGITYLLDGTPRTYGIEISYKF